VKTHKLALAMIKDGRMGSPKHKIEDLYDDELYNVVFSKLKNKHILIKPQNIEEIKFGKTILLKEALKKLKETERKKKKNCFVLLLIATLQESSLRQEI